MTTTSVHVEIGGTTVHAGTLHSHRRRGTESSALVYDSGYVATPGAYALDATLPLSMSPIQTDLGVGLFRAFGDCAPDTWGRRLLLRREAALAHQEGSSPRGLGEIDYLLGVRDDLRQGALRFRAEEGVGSGEFLAAQSDGVPVLTDVQSLLDLADRAEREAVDLSDLQRLIQVGGSLGGAGPKAHVLDNSGRLAIAKFPSSNQGTWNVMAWEKVAFDLGRAAGIVLPESQLLRLAGRCVHVVDRFDRAANGDRIGYVSAMTMLEASDGDERSYLEIAEVIERVSGEATKDLQQLWRRILFSVLISNTDDHLRNHGFLHAHGDVWQLSPAFDINPVPDPAATNLHTLIDDARSDLDVDLVLSVAEYFRLDRPRAEAVMVQVAAVVSGWRDVARRNGLSKSEIGEMAHAFSPLGQVVE